jgi:hypothetical protein
MRSVSENNERALAEFKQGALPVIAATTLDPTGSRPICFCWVNAIGKMDQFNEIKQGHLRNDGGDPGLVFSSWSAALNPKLQSDSFVKLKCEFKSPVQTEFQLLFKLPESYPALMALIETENLAIVPVEKELITRAEVETSGIKLATSFEVPKPPDNFQAWLQMYEMMSIIHTGLAPRQGAN